MSLLLATDRRDLCLIRFLSSFDSLNVEEQKASALFACHVASQTKGRDFMLFQSRKEIYNDSQEMCNSDVALKIVKASLNNYNPMLRFVEIFQGLLYCRVKS